MCGGIPGVIVGVGNENDGTNAGALHNRGDSVLQMIILYTMREMRADNNRLLVITNALKLLNDERAVLKGVGDHTALFLRPPDWLPPVFVVEERRIIREIAMSTTARDHIPRTGGREPAIFELNDVCEIDVIVSQPSFQ